MIAVAAVYASDVVELGDSDFESRMAGFDIALVKFYAPWCGHCKRMAPEFDTASTILKNDDNPVTLVKVDCTEAGKDTCSKYDVKGFPTLKIFKNGVNSMDYNGPRESDGIVKYMRSKAGPSSKNLETMADAEKYFGNQNDAAIVGYFSDGSGTASKEFSRVADALNEDFRFAHTSATDVVEKYGSADSVVLYRPKVMATKMEDSELKYDGDLTTSGIKKWINENIHGLAGRRTTANQEQFPRPLVTVYFDVDYVKNPKGTNYWRNRVMKIAKKVQAAGKKVSFAVSNAGDFGHELGEYNLNFNDKPVVAARDASEQKFPMQEEFSLETFEQFVNDFLEGKLTPYLKSEDVPEDNSAPVKVVVAKNFDEIVNDPERDVLIEFYAPWCGHCKNLAPIYDDLAEKLQKENGLTIAKMDATANDVPSPFQVQGFPTIFYAPKNNKSNPKKYEGGRELNDFIKYLARESTDGLTGYDRKGKKIKKTEL